MKITLSDKSKAYVTPRIDGEPKCAENEAARLVLVTKIPMPGKTRIHPDVFPYQVNVLGEDKNGFLMWVQMTHDDRHKIAWFFVAREKKGHKMLRKWWWIRYTITEETGKVRK